MGIFDRLRRIDPRVHEGWRRAAARGIQFALALIDQVHTDKVVIRASGLAYATLLATVPLVAVLFAMFSAFASFGDLRERVQEFIFSQLLPTRQDELIAYINQFTDNASKLGFFGFIALIITAIMLLDNVESNFNAIWHVTARRRLVNKITAYTSVLVFGTVFLGASLSISARIKAMIFTGRLMDIGTFAQISNWVFPLLLSFLAFLMMYLVIPFTRVQFSSAMVGAAVASLLWESGKNLFALSVGQSVRYSTIYGSLAVVPIFLVWIYITWIIVLLGLEITFTHQHLTSLIRRNFFRDTTERDRMSLLLKVYTLISHRFDNGAPPVTSEELSERFEIPIDAMEGRVASHLEKCSLVLRVSSDSAPAFVPCTSPDRVSAVDLVRSVIGGPGTVICPDGTLEHAVDGMLDSFQTGGEQAIDGLTVRDLLESIRPQNDEEKGQDMVP